MRLFNRKQLEIVKVACRDINRQALNGIHVDGNVAIVSDGHTLLRVESEQVASVEWPANGVKWSDNDKPFTIPLATAEKALKNIPKKVGGKILTSIAIGLKEVPTGEPDRVVCQTTDMDITDNVESVTVDGKFPDFKRVIPEVEDNPEYQRVGISAKYLMDMCSLLGGYNPKSKIITLYVKKDTPEVNGPKYSESAKLGEHYPVVLTADDGEGNKATAVIMPMRL